MMSTPETKTTTPAAGHRPARNTHTALALVLCSAFGLGMIPVADAQLSIGLAMPGVNIGINVPFYPDFEPMQGYPVYYAPSLDMNMFFYDGLYWNYIGDQWYSSSWYNGPWDMIGREFVPVFILRIPVRYYRRPPSYFRGWAGDEPPRWGDRWGREWQQRREGWDRWDHRSPAAAPLPTYQRDFAGARYPQPGQQRTVRDTHYSYHPQDTVARQHFDAAPARQDGGRGPGSRSDRPPTATDHGKPADRPTPADRPAPADRPRAGAIERPARPPAADSPTRNAAPDRRPEPQRTPTPQRTQAPPRDQAPERRAEPPRAAPPVRAPQQERRPEPQRAEPAPVRSQPPERRQEAPRSAPQPSARPAQAPPAQRQERPSPQPGRGPDRREDDRSPHNP
jgi:hypothetical protein